MERHMPEQQFQTWWAGLVAAIPVIGFWYKSRADLRAEILACDKKAALAHQRAEEVRLELSETRLNTQKDFVTNHALRDIVADIKNDAKEREMRVSKGIAGIHQRLDEAMKFERREKPRAD